MEKKDNITKKPCIMRIFELIRYQNTELHAKHLIWVNETTLKFSFFFFLSNWHQNVLKNLYVKIKHHCQKRLFFLNLLHTKPLKRVQNTLYGETEQH